MVIPARNAREHLAECLASVDAQAADVALETLVVDDGSTDDTAEIARGHPGAHCLSQPHRGPSAARNAGIAAARGKFVALLDADDLWPPGKLALQLRALAAHPEAAMVFGDCHQFDDRGTWPRTEFAAGGFGAAAWGTSGLVPEAYARLLEENFITTGSVVVRRSALADAGGFAEDLKLVEDLDLWLRIARCHPIAWCEAVCLLRRRHAGNSSRDREAMSLAYLEVLHRQGNACPAIGRLIAETQLRLAEHALRRGRWKLATRRVWQGLSGGPRPRSIWHLGQAVASSLAGRKEAP